ncbi:hypothetical protein [Actinomadura logoneensis]|nr:hypothetical protein [Actinomadura logoneensis]
MKQSVRKATLAAAAATSVLALTTAPAHATGPRLATSHAITLTNSGNVVFTDISTGAAIVCDTSTGTGTAQDGPVPPPPTFSINSLTFSGKSNPGGWCSGSLGLMVQVTASNLPWSFNPVASASGVFLGTLTGVKVKIVGSDNCHATLAGPAGAGASLSATYTNSTATLTLGSTGSTTNLSVQTTDVNCDPTLFNVGDVFKLSASYKISPPLPTS